MGTRMRPRRHDQDVSLPRDSIFETEPSADLTAPASHSGGHGSGAQGMVMNAAGDQTERQADDIADRVTRSGHGSARESGGLHDLVSRSAAPAGGNDGHDVSSVVTPVIAESDGQPLATETRAFMEDRFGHDFSRVRIHDDRRAAASAADMSARAYTVGNHIAFGAGNYAPDHPDGRRLLAHELTHVVQQGASSTSVSSGQSAGVVQRDPIPGAADPAPQPAGPQAAPAAPGAAPNAAPAAATGPGMIDGDFVGVQPDLVNWYDFRLKLLSAQGVELQQYGLPVPQIVAEATAVGTRNKLEAEAAGKAGLDAASAVKAQVWADYKFTPGSNYAEAAKAVGAAQALKDAAAKEKETASEVEMKVIPALREEQRKRFAKEDESALEHVAGAVAQGLSTVLMFKEGAEEISHTAHELEEIGQIAIKDTKRYPPVASKIPKVMHGLELAHQALAALELLHAGLELLHTSNTQMGDAKTGVKVMATMVDAGGALLGASAGFTMYTSLYLKPMTEKCLEQMGKLEKVAGNVNRDLMRVGNLDKVDWLLEPGGRPMYDFMSAVMKAAAIEGVPSPAPAEVSKYLVKKEDQLEAGAKDKEEMPMTGHWFWRKTDAGKISEWVFNQRYDIWGMLYGDLPVPK